MDELFPPLQISPLRSKAFTGTFRSAGTDSLQLVDISATAHTVERETDAAHSRSRDFYKLSLQVSGSGLMRQGEREIMLSPGAITVYDTAQPYVLHFEEEYRFIVAMFPKEALTLPPGLPGDLSGTAISAATGIGSIAAAYLRSLASDLELLASPAGHRLAGIGIDLITTLFASTLELTAGGESHTTRGSLLAEILYYIANHLSDPGLGPEHIAEAHFISVRHLYNVFAETGTSVAQHIKRRRLESIKRDLIAPELISLTISQIAEQWAMGDGAYFSKVFKEAFGETPGTWRRRAQVSPISSQNSA